MDDSEFETRIIGLIEQAVPRKLKKGQIERGMFLQRDLGVDSIGIAMLVFRLEELFDIELDTDNLEIDMGRVKTVGDAIDISRSIVASATAVEI